MWCGPDAVARLTPWDRHQAWLHIRWMREREGKPLPDQPRGGTYAREVLGAIQRAGFTVRPVPRPLRRNTLRQWWAYYRNEFRGGVLIAVPGHFLALRPSDALPLRYARHHVRAAWWVGPKQEQAS